MTRSILFLALLSAPLQVLAAAPTQGQAPVAQENALKYLQAARAALKPADNASPSPEQARIIVEANAAVFPLLQRAVGLPLRFEKQNFVQMQFSLFASVRDMARLLALRSQVQARAGDASGATESGLLCLSLGMKMQEDGAIISSLVGNAIEAIGLRALEKLAPTLDATQLKAAARGLAQAEARRPAFAVALASEREVSQDLMRQQFQAQQPAPLDAAMQQKLLLATREAAERDDALLARPFALTRGLDFREPDDGAEEDAAGEDALDEDVPPAVGPNFDAHAWAEVMQKTLRPIKHGALLNRTRAQARLALLEAALAARAYRLEHNKPPASLQVLAPEYLPALPLDAFELNAPLQLKADGESVLIYSVGPDGLDDGGQAVEDRGLGLDSLGDLAAPAALLKP